MWLLILLSGIASAIVTYIWSAWFLLLIPLQYYGYYSFEITTNTLVSSVVKKLPKRSSIIRNNFQIGKYFYGKWYIGYIDETESHNQMIKIFTHRDYYKELIATETPNELFAAKKNQTINITYLAKIGGFAWIRYNERKLNVSNFNLQPRQRTIIYAINNIFKKKNHLTVLVYGSPGIGKSMVPILLAKQLKGAYCNSYAPTDPGDSLEILHSSQCPCAEHPLIVVWEETDIMIKKIHENAVPGHKQATIECQDKSSYTRLMDNFDRGIYPHTILIMTSNKPKAYFDNLDTAFMRKGRINLVFNMDVVVGTKARRPRKKKQVAK
jgi:hypothetical protein